LIEPPEVSIGWPSFTVQLCLPQNVCKICGHIVKAMEAPPQSTTFGSKALAGMRAIASFPNTQQISLNNPLFIQTPSLE
jgi:hypothetical protein